MDGGFIKAGELDAIIASIADPVIIYDRDARPINMNAAGRQYLATLDSELWKGLAAARALKGETVRGMEMSFTGPAGDERTVLVSSAPILSGSEVTGAVSSLHDITAIKEAERVMRQLVSELGVVTAEALRRADELDTLLASIAAPVILFDGDGDPARVNPAARSFFGFDPIGMSGQALIERLEVRGDPAGGQTADLGFPRALKGETVRDAQFDLVDGEGVPRTVLSSCSPLQSAGKTAGAVCSLHDITDRRNAEEALMVANERLELAQEGSGAGIWDWDVASGRIEWSDRMFEMYGLDPDKQGASFDTWNAVLHPDDREAANRRIEEALRDHRPLTSEYRVIRPDGEERWISALGRGMYDEGGEPARMTGICLDITEKKHWEEALKRAKDDWERTFDADPDLIAILDTKHRIVRANRAMTRRLEASQGQCTGMTCFSCVHGTDAPPELCPHAMTLRDGKEHVAEIHEPTLGGDFLVTTTPLLDENGKMTGSVHVARDITERKRAEQALAESEQKYRLLFERMMTGFALHEIILDRDGKPVDYRFLELNPAFEQLTGLKAAEAVGRTVKEVIPGTEQEWIDIYGKVALTGESVHFDRFFPPLKRHYDIVAYRPKNGQFAVTFTDITERKKAEAQLAYQVDLLSKIHDAVYATDQDFKATFWNRAAEEAYGWKKEEVLGRRLPDFFKTIVPGASGEETIRRLFETGHFEGEISQMRKDGTYIPVEARTTVLRDEKGSVAGIVSATRDISERKRAQERIRRLASFPEQAPILVVELSPEGRLLFQNSAAAAAFEATGLKDPLEILPAPARSLLEMLERRPGEPLFYEVAVGDRVYAENIFRPPETDSLRVYGIDITRLRKAEEEMAHMASLAERAPLIILEFDGKGDIVFTNMAAIMAVEAVGTTDPARLLPAPPAALIARLSETVAGPAYEEVRIGDKVYGEYFVLAPGKRSLRVYGFDLAAWKRGGGLPRTRPEDR